MGTTIANYLREAGAIKFRYEVAPGALPGRACLRWRRRGVVPPDDGEDLQELRIDEADVPYIMLCFTVRKIGTSCPHSQQDG